MRDPSLFTYQTRPTVDEQSDTILDEFAVLFGKVERSLFRHIVSGAQPHALKSSFLKCFGITARQFNSADLHPINWSI